ncbi:MAG: hypothetical protein AAFP78_08830, partial [Pseudomonadota bacterium]
DQVTQRNAAMVEEMTAASTELSSDATRLTVNIEQFRIGSIGAGAERTPQGAAPAAAPSGENGERFDDGGRIDADGPQRESREAKVVGTKVVGANALAVDDDDWEAF